MHRDLHLTHPREVPPPSPAHIPRGSYMRSRHSVKEIMSRRNPRGARSPATRSLADTLVSGCSALLVAPDAAERELPWRLAAAAGRLPLLVIAPSDSGLAGRAEELATELDLVVCHLHAQLTDLALDTLRQQLADGKWDAALISGRSLSDPRVMRAANALAPKLLVIEAAHRLSVHAHDYDLAWLHAAQIARNTPSVLAVTDLAGGDARAEILTHLGPGEHTVVLSGLDRPDVRVEVRRVPNQPQKDAHLLGLFLDLPHRAVVYVNERVEAERVAALIHDERGFDALDITNLDASEFGAALRRFREGGVRVLVATGALEPALDWPEIPVVASIDLPERLELLHRRMHTASGDGAHFMLIYDPGEKHEEEDEEHEVEDEQWGWEECEEERDRVRRERRALQAALDAGQMLALHAAAITGERLSSVELSRRTGLNPDQIRLGLEALIGAGAVRPLARGDDWVRAEAGDALTGDMLERWGRHASAIRHARLARIDLVLNFVAAEGCRRKALAEALEYPLIPGDCRCDRCHRRAPVRISARVSSGYPIRVGNFRGWVLGLYRRPGDDRPAEGPGRLVERLKYHGEEGCGRRLAWLMHKRVRESRTYRDCDTIVTVPPSDSAQPDSPAAVLAREIGRLSHLPLADVLETTKSRQPQKELTSESAKKRNIAGAFEVTSSELIDGRIVLLVDDIYDSGATMHEAAITLIRAGAKDVRMLAAVKTAFGWRRDT